MPSTITSRPSGSTRTGATRRRTWRRRRSKEEALRCFQQAAPRQPNQPNVGRYSAALAHALRETNQGHLAEQWYGWAERYDHGWAWAANELAWSLATNPDAGKRNGPLA